MDLRTEEEEHLSMEQDLDDTMSEGEDSSVHVSKKPRFAIKFLSKALEKRFNQFNIGHINILFGKSIFGDEFQLCGLVDIFDKIGMLPIIFLPDACYPSLV